MFFVILGMMMGATQPSGGALCEVARAALADLPPVGAGNEFVEIDPERSDSMKRCPDLRGALPSGYRAANDDARSRASVHAPIPGLPPPDAAFIYAIGLPVIAPDGRSATVEILCTCTGLCGSATRSRYIRTPQGWRRDGKPRMLWVS